MTAVLSILLLVLKILGALLLFAIALVLLVCLVPFGAHIDWRPGALTVDAVLGPVRLHLLPREQGKTQEKKQTPPPPAEAKPQAPAPAAATAPPKAQTQTPPAAQSQPKPAPAPAAQAQEQAPGFVDKLLAAARRDPVVFIERVVTHAIFAGGSLLRGVRVTGLWVWWPVHADEASATALLYGSLMAALNNALVRLRQHMTIRPQELWLEPDFTGEQAAKSHVECTVTMRPIILVVLAPRLLWRIWRDPAFAGAFPFTKAPEPLDNAS